MTKTRAYYSVQENGHPACNQFTAYCYDNKILNVRFLFLIKILLSCKEIRPRERIVLKTNFR